MVLNFDMEDLLASKLVQDRMQAGTVQARLGAVHPPGKLEHCGRCEATHGCRQMGHLEWRGQVGNLGLTTNFALFCSGASFILSV
jgi:hypothetical protein